MVFATVVRRASSGQGERLPQRHRPEVLDLHLPGHGSYPVKAIGFAHCFIEQRCDNAAVRVSRRALEALRQAYMANDLLRVISEELQPQARPVCLSATKAVMERAMREWYK